MPVGFDARKEIHQRIFYTWEALGLLEPMHVKTFERFHVQKLPINSRGRHARVRAANGLDADKVKAAWNSFSVQTKCREAKRLEDDYGIERMPEMAIAGRFTAIAQPEARSGQRAGDHRLAARPHPPRRLIRERRTLLAPAKPRAPSVGWGRHRRINPVRKGASPRAASVRAG